VLATADGATLLHDRPDRNMGAADTIEVDDDCVKHGLIRFELAGIGEAPIQRATMRLFVLEGSDHRGVFSAAGEPAWSEDEVTWANAPRSHGPAVAELRRVTEGTWIEIDVTAAIGGDVAPTIRISTPSTNGVDYASSEHDSGNAPRLVIEFG
jgi:hypothetical protein